MQALHAAEPSTAGCKKSLVTCGVRCGGWFGGFAQRTDWPPRQGMGVLAPLWHRCSLRRLMPIPRAYFFRVSVSVANGEVFPDLSTLSIVHDHVSVARSYAKVV